MNFPHTLIYRQCVTGGQAVRGAALPASLCPVFTVYIISNRISEIQ